VKFDPDDLWLDPAPRPSRPILPSLSLGLDEIFVTGPSRTGEAKPSWTGDFMPVLSVTLVRRGSPHSRATVFSLS
jgi:hypothetical protein